MRVEMEQRDIQEVKYIKYGDGLDMLGRNMEVLRMIYIFGLYN